MMPVVAVRTSRTPGSSPRRLPGPGSGAVVELMRCLLSVCTSSATAVDGGGPGSTGLRGGCLARRRVRERIELGLQRPDQRAVGELLLQEPEAVVVVAQAATTNLGLLHRPSTELADLRELVGGEQHQRLRARVRHLLSQGRLAMRVALDLLVLGHRTDELRDLGSESPRQDR